MVALAVTRNEADGRPDLVIRIGELPVVLMELVKMDESVGVQLEAAPWQDAEKPL
jgi:hypothetical protein